EDPIVGAGDFLLLDPRLVPLHESSQCQRPLAVPRLWLVNVTAAMTLLDPDRALLRIEMFELQADRLGDPGAGVEARLANQQLRIFKAREYGGGLIVVEDTLRANGPLSADL